MYGSKSNKQSMSNIKFDQIYNYLNELEINISKIKSILQNNKKEIYISNNQITSIKQSHLYEQEQFNKNFIKKLDNQIISDFDGSEKFNDLYSKFENENIENSNFQESESNRKIMIKNESFTENIHKSYEQNISITNNVKDNEENQNYNDDDCSSFNSRIKNVENTDLKNDLLDNSKIEDKNLISERSNLKEDQELPNLNENDKKIQVIDKLIKKSLSSKNDYDPDDNVKPIKRNSQSVKINKITSIPIDQTNDPLNDLKQYIDSATIGALVINSQHQIIHSNSFIYEHILFKKQTEEIDIFSIIPESELTFLQLKFKELDQDSTVSQFELMIINKDNIIKEQIINLSQHEINQNKQTIMYVSLTDQDENTQIINPRNTQYQFWVGFVVAIIIWLMIYLPQDMVFNNSKVVDQFEIQMIVIFGIDIILHFNLGQEEDSKLIVDRYKIAMQYFFGFFIIDLISIIPFELLFNNFFINTQIIKSIKLVRILRFTKIFRLTKIFTLIGILSDDNIKVAISLIKNNQGQLDLLKNMGQIQLFAHQFSILFYSLESNQICNKYTDCWLKEQMENGILDEVITQNHLLQQHINVALGMGGINSFNNIEIYQHIVWMIIGLSLFGYGIGNISTYLNQSNKQELEFKETINYFNDLCIMNDIDPKLQNMIISNIELNFSKFMNKELNQYASSLSPHIFDQLELSLLEDLIIQFPLFQRINTRTIRLIKTNMNIDHQKKLIRAGQFFKYIYFITEGTVNVYNEQMAIDKVNQQSKDEIFGFEEFLNYFDHKYDINIRKIMDNHISYEKVQKDQQIIKEKSSVQKNKYNKQESINNQSIFDTQFNSIKRNRKMDYHNLKKTFEEEFEEKGLEFKQQITKEEEQHKQKYNAIASDNVNQLMIPFSVIEEILFTDVDTFLLMQQYNIQKNRLITNEEVNLSEYNLNLFNNEDRYGLIVMSDGTIYDYNHKFASKIKEHKHVSGKRLIDLMKTFKSGQIKKYQMKVPQGLRINEELDKIYSDEELIDGEQQIFDTGYNYYKVKYQYDQVYMIIRYNKRIKNVIHQYAKSIIYVNFIYFENVEDQ